jgi:hypothetical protein
VNNIGIENGNAAPTTKFKCGLNRIDEKHVEFSDEKVKKKTFFLNFTYIESGITCVGSLIERIDKEARERGEFAFYKFSIGNENISRYSILRQFLDSAQLWMVCQLTVTTLLT